VSQEQDKSQKVTLDLDRYAADRRLFASGWSMLAGRGGAQIIYSAAVGRQSAPHAGVISPHFLLPLGYGHYDIRLSGLYTVLVRPTD